ncbi:MAG: hypothetical protein M0R46_12990 [Candidatus Muirbacterium halophilum]|nr:hypothetical protein [Candidatus Muirbacterium halophilum]MCK9476835.1 hypothetical protein [Candidatus Muirbacterium halophilum]
MTKKGFTFAELMIAVGISTGVMAVVFTFYIMVNKFYYVGANKSILVSDMKNSVNIMVEELSRIEKIIDMGDDYIEAEIHSMKKKDNYGNSLENVKYELDRKENKLYRIYENRKKMIFTSDSINEYENEKIPLIRPYIKAYESVGYIYYKPDYNDSEKTERVVFIEINLFGNIKKEHLFIRTGVRLEFRHSKVIQPYWSFN